MAARNNEAYEYYDKVLKKATQVLAPMVDQSELAFRMLSRKYGAQLCFSPMYHASVFIRDKLYREDALLSCPDDRPLVIQFCANDPEILLQASLLAQDHCDGIDINLGCPQAIARKGHYGAFLQDEWETIAKMIKICHKNLKVPISCKIRIFKSLERTIDYTKMLVSSGCQLLTVHGRSREQKGTVTGIADWNYVKEIKKVVNIPVFSNGNIQYLKDIKKCIEETDVDGVMVAEGSLHNPAIFKGINPICWDMALEYISFAKIYKLRNNSIARGHIFKMCHHGLSQHTIVRDMVGNSKTLEELEHAMKTLKDICIQNCQTGNKNINENNLLPFPHWISQPYVRPSRPITNLSTKINNNDAIESTENKNSGEISNKKRKRLIRKHGSNIPKQTVEIKDLINTYKAKKMNSRPKYEMCTNCGNPRGANCAYSLCKTCCKIRNKKIPGNCLQHSQRRKKRIKTVESNTEFELKHN